MRRTLGVLTLLLLLSSPASAQTADTVQLRIALDSVRVELVRARAFIRSAETQFTKTLDRLDRARALRLPIGTPVPPPDTAPTPPPPPPPPADTTPAGAAVSWWDDFRAGNFTARGMRVYFASRTDLISLVPSTGLGFPAGITHVAQNFYRPELTFTYGTDDLWPAPAVGGHVFYRMLIRNALPATTGAGTGGDHGFQESVNEPGGIKWFWRIWQGTASTFSLEASTWQVSTTGPNPWDNEFKYAAPKNTVLRLEWRITKLTATTGEAAFRVYNNATGALLAERLGMPMSGMSDDRYRQARWGMSGQGGADFTGGSVYWGAIAVRVSNDANAWIGAYPTASER